VADVGWFTQRRNGSTGNLTTDAHLFALMHEWFLAGNPETKNYALFEFLASWVPSPTCFFVPATIPKKLLRLISGFSASGQIVF
jgi:hypothetical protein